MNLFRKLPKVDKLLNDDRLKKIASNLNYSEFYNLITETINSYREKIKNKEIEDFELTDIINDIIKNSKKYGENNLKRVINGTGVIIHTNLGRSLINSEIMEKVSEISTHYNNLEYDIENGSRYNRNLHVEGLIAKLTGAESALVVNNNAAAVIICLNEFAKDKYSIVSRGELVEIGGSFRIPEIMELSNSKLKEVGATNKTHLRDYENAISEDTGVLLKVHRSNFKILGFTEAVSNVEIANLGKKYNILTMEDLGSGTLVDFSKYGVTKEPTVQESVKSGIDIITISGDKLLGGPQAGIILGKKNLVDKLRKNPYLRAMRVDKFTLSALENLLRLYLDEREAVKKIPTLRMIVEDSKIVYEKAKLLKEKLDNINIQTEIIKTRAKIGGGSMPEETVSSYGLKFMGDAKKLESFLRLGEINIIGRIENDSYILDLKTILSSDYEDIINKVKSYE